MTGSLLPQTDVPVPPASVGAGPLVSYSQNGEDVRLWRVFEDVAHGFYVDVGAGDPWDGSMTKLFYDRGWSGINVEPSPVYEALATARPRDLNIRAAVGEWDGAVRFFVTHPDVGMSTVDLSAHAHVSEAIERVEEITVPQRRLDAILREGADGRSFHFLKIDVEGAEHHVLSSMDWSAHRPIVVVVEAVKSWSATPTHDDWEGILLDADYVPAAFDGINRFYVDREHNELGEVLAYPVSALDRFTPAPLLRAQREANRLAAKNVELRDELEHTRTQLEELTNVGHRESRQLDRLHDELAEVYGSRTWRAGRMVTRAGAPVLGVARRLGRGRRPGTHMTPESAYAYATRPGQPWHFPRRGEPPKRPRSGLDSVIRVLDPFASPLSSNQATRLRREIDRTRWADDRSLAERRLSWDERQAVVEADALAELVLGRETSDADVPGNGALAGDHVVVVDARSLQRAQYRGRGVGVHSRGVLHAAIAAARGAPVHLLTNPELPELEEDVAALGDQLITTPYPVRHANVRLFVQLSPMTETLGPATQFLSSQDCRTVAVVYDFIPGEHPAAYLASPAAELSNLVRTEALRHYDLLLPISHATAEACRRLVREAGRLVVTGVANPLGAEDAPQPGTGPYVLAPTGSDARKNGAAAVAALAHHLQRSPSPLRLVVTGRLRNAQAVALRQMTRALRLPDDAVELVGAVPARDLADLYRCASLAVVPSFAEGFSIPVAEAVEAGTPVVASDLAVHRELVGAGPWLAPPDDVPALGEALGHVLTHSEEVLALQREALGDRADAGAVLERVTRALSGLVRVGDDDRSAPPARAARRARPRLAVVSPFPPHSSGVADYTAATFGRIADYADVDVYTSAPATRNGGISVERLSAAPYLDGRYDAVVSVVGNSHFHFPVLDLLSSYGGACIAHDNRMIESYGYDRGHNWVAQLLSRHRPVDVEDVTRFMQDPDEMPAAGYGLIAHLATPLLVHSRTLASRIGNETGIAPIALPFVPYNLPSVDIVDRAVRSSARARLGLSDGALHVAVFGGVDRRTKGTDLIVAAASWLQDWAPVHLHVVGGTPLGELESLQRRAAELDVRRCITFYGRVPRTDYEDFLLAADVAVQIRTSSMESLSGGLLDCLAYGVPTVTTDELAEELDAPSYVATVAPVTSSLLLAEAIAGLRDRRLDDSPIETERRAYLKARSLDSYARRLLDSLGLGGQG